MATDLKATAPLVFTQHEPRRTKRRLVTGGAADTDLDCADIAAGDEILWATRYHSGAPSDVTSEVRISAAGKIQLDTTNTTGDVVEVVFCTAA